ncbi:MAG: Uma2 family endonuclease [Paenibacillaceae bacterium]|nr:Uma2 family endonuclease [Paenibacillaceae bacterium]
MADYGNRYEVVEGRLEPMAPAPSPGHQSISRELLKQVDKSCESDYLIYFSPIDVILSSKDVRQPDLLMLHRSRSHIVTRRGIEGAPDLVAEILSPGSRSRDKIGKSRTYAKYGVPEYWIVDPDALTLERYVLRDGHYELDEIFENDDQVTSDKLPCVSFKVSALFAGMPDYDRRN